VRDDADRWPVDLFVAAHLFFLDMRARQARDDLPDILDRGAAARLAAGTGDLLVDGRSFI
jgi:hypothetical protein